jgi:hypothetical protein
LVLHSATVSETRLKEEAMQMSYKKKWKVLADLLAELQKGGEKIPADMISDLRSAKTMIQVLKADPTHIENISRIETYLRNVEAYAIIALEKQGTGNVEEWLKKLKEAKRVENNEKKEADRFVTRVPRDKDWMRIQISEDIPREEMKKIVKEEELSYRIQKNGYMLVYGNKENIKSLVKKLAEQFRGARKG